MMPSLWFMIIAFLKSDDQIQYDCLRIEEKNENLRGPISF